MPSVNRQYAKTNRVETASSDDILADAVPISELVNEYIKFCCYGANRTGKTTLAASFPKPLLLIAFEPNRTGGALSVTKIPGITYKRVTSTRNALLLAERLGQDNRSNWVRGDDGKWKSQSTFDGEEFATHVLDTATSLQDLILQELLDLPAVPEQLSWGMVSGDTYRQRSEKCREAMRPFLNLPAHTVVCAKERDHNPKKDNGIDERGKKITDMRPKILRGLELESFFAADLGGATVGWLHDACDYIGRLYIDKEYKSEKREVKIGSQTKVIESEIETGKHIRKLLTMYHPNFAAGMRSANPESIPQYIIEPTWDSLKKVIDGERIPNAKYSD